IAYNNRSFVEQEHAWNEARSSCEAAIGRLEALVGAESRMASATTSRQSDLALCYNNLGAIHGHLENDVEACEAYRRAIAIQEVLHRQAPAVVQFQSDLAVTWNNLGRALERGAQHGESAEAFQRSRGLFAALVHTYPSDVRFRSSLAGVLNNEAMAAEADEDYARAESLYSVAIEHQQFAVENAPEQPQYREFLSKHQYNHSRVLRLLGRPGDAAATT